MFSDHLEKDPHPVQRSYWKFLIAELTNLEKNMHEQYYEIWGDTPAHRRRRMAKTVLNGTAGVVLFFTWYLLLGPVVFFGVFLPASVIGVLHVSHFNWVTHNASVSDDFRPVNNDDGLFWLGNRIFFGIYMHANHHAYASVFNPLKISAERASRVAAKIERMHIKVNGPQATGLGGDSAASSLGA
jgi:stearoyl-CoA desaturase (delta-9 desaturase)